MASYGKDFKALAPTGKLQKAIVKSVTTFFWLLICCRCFLVTRLSFVISHAVVHRRRRQSRYPASTLLESGAVKASRKSRMNHVPGSRANSCVRRLSAEKFYFLSTIPRTGASSCVYILLRVGSHSHPIMPCHFRIGRRNCQHWRESH